MNSARQPLQADQIEAFDTAGFLVLTDVATPAEVQQVGDLLLPLFGQVASLSEEIAIGLGDDRRLGREQSIVEINWTTEIEPRLKKTSLFRKCKRLAAGLARERVFHSYDHAIYKPPHNQAATEWHQDQAYRKSLRSPRTLHFWLPLQDVTLDGGCMRYLPGSHRSGLVPHRPRSPRAHALVADGIDASASVACPIPAGGATVHDPWTLHYSGPNDTDQPRLAWIVQFCPWGRFGSLRVANLSAELQRFVKRVRSWRRPFA